MRYLFINGSAHKGNTWKLVEMVQKYMREKDSTVVFEEIHLYEKKVAFCCGCSNCFRLGNDKCPHFISLEPIIRAMDQADGIIFASTTYFMRETAILKNLFDHFCFYTHRPHFFTSKALILTTTGGVGGKAAAKSIASFLNAIGFNRCYQYSVTTHSWNDYQSNKQTQRALQQITRKFMLDVESRQLHSSKVGVLIPYNLFRGMSLSYIKGTEYETEDGVYWIQDDRQNYLYDSRIKVPLYKKPIGHIFYLMGKYMGKKITVTYRK